MNDLAGTGKRLIGKYRGENLYLVSTEQSLDISHSTHRIGEVEQRTLVAFDIISALATALLAEGGYTPKDMADLFFTCSQTKGDLADMLTKSMECI